MKRTFSLALILLACTALLVAQAANTSAPTKVTGKPKMTKSDVEMHQGFSGFNAENFDPSGLTPCREARVSL